MDTSAWYAIIDKNDRDHLTAITKIQILDRPLVTSNYVFNEILTLLKARLGPSVAIPFGRKLWNQEVAILARITEKDEVGFAWKNAQSNLEDSLIMLWPRQGTAPAFSGYAPGY